MFAVDSNNFVAAPKLYTKLARAESRARRDSLSGIRVCVWELDYLCQLDERRLRAVYFSGRKLILTKDTKTEARQPAGRDYSRRGCIEQYFA